MSNTVDILVVDDERINLKLIEGILKGGDVNPVLASSGPEALHEVEKHDFAVALLDVMMPGMDGFELAEALRSSDLTSGIPIIFITAISKEQRHVFRGYELGAVDYLFKPVEPEVLRGKVGIFAELHRKKRSLEETTRRLESTVKALEESRQALEGSEERYRMVADYNHDWESWIDPQGMPIYISPSCERICGYPPERFLEDCDFFQRIIHRDDLPAWKHYMLADSPADTSLDFRIHHANARIKWVNLVKHNVRGDNGSAMGVRTSMRDVTSRKRMEAQLKHSSLHDPLTGLPNRVLLLDRVSQAIERSLRTDKYFGVLFVNIDRFQAVNDLYGHTMGDRILVAMGGRLVQTVRPVDTVARFGGDEFVVLIEDMVRKTDVRELVKLVQKSLDEPFSFDGIDFSVSVSLGLEIGKNGQAANQENLVHNAQLAMYKAKRLGKNRSVEYSSKMREGLVDIVAIESDVRRGLRNGEFEAYYQPIVNLADGTLYGFEALARWNHPERGLVGPGEFIPVAEETGLIVELGVQILDQACSTLSVWRNRYPQADDLTISVNISAKQFGEATLVGDVKSIIEATSVPPNRLKLEITETVVMLDAVESSTRLNLLKALGILLSIDDFGTGYSSMSYLQKFPMDQLKVDLSFVRQMEKAPENIEIVRAIVNMAHSLRLRVVAEGIETERQRDLLYSLQCDYGQGYLYSKPLRGTDAEELLKKS